MAGADRLADKESLAVALDLMARPGSLLLIFGNDEPGDVQDALAWHAVAVDETNAAYFVRARAVKGSAPERLRYLRGIWKTPTS